MTLAMICVVVGWFLGGFTSGVAGYIVKPVDSEMLLKKLGDILGEDTFW